MQRRQGLLFPMMVAAAASVIAFGCIGIAGITGHLPLTSPAEEPIAGNPAHAPTLVTADAQVHSATVENTLKDAPPAPIQDTATGLGQPIVRN